jgi:hypothetical protein
VPTAIAVTSPDLVLPPLDRQTPPAAVQPQPTLEASLTGMHALIEQHGYVIALHPASGDDPAVQRLRTVRSVLESDRVALIGIDRWLGGLHVTSHGRVWRWDHARGVLSES